MKINDVTVGGYYIAKVSGRLVPILVESINWTTKKVIARNMVTQYRIRCTGRRLREKITYEKAMELVHYCKKG